MKRAVSTHFSSRFLLGFSVVSLFSQQTLLVGCEGDNARADEQAAARVAAENEADGLHV